MSDRRWKHKKNSRTNPRTNKAMVDTMRRNIRVWEEAGIIPKIRYGEIVDE